MYDKRVKVSMVPESVEIKQDWFGTALGIVFGSLILMPKGIRSLNLRPIGHDVVFNHYAEYSIWNPERRLSQYRQNIGLGKERDFVVKAYPVGLIHHERFKSMCYFILAYEQEGKMVWLK